MLGAVKLLGKGLGSVGLVPAVCVLTAASLVAAVVGSVVGAVYGACSVIKEGPAMTVVYAGAGFKEGLNIVQTNFKNSLFTMTKFVGLTK